MQIDGATITACLEAMRRTDEVPALRSEVVRALALCGISAGFFVAPLTFDSRVGRVLTNFGLPEEWERSYRARLNLPDPLLEQVMKHVGPFHWPEDFSDEALSPKQRRYLADLEQWGLGRGIGIVCYGPQGRSGLLAAVWQHEQPPSAEVVMALHAIGQTSFQRYCQLEQTFAARPVLSNRELEVLGWICSGKSNPVIAQILGISRSTVDVYIRRIFAKLNVSDRTAASVRAFALGLVVADDIAVLVERARTVLPASGP